MLFRSEFRSRNDDGTNANGNFGIAESGNAHGVVNMNNGSLTVGAWALFSAWQDDAAASVATLNATDSAIDLQNDSGDHGRLLWGRRGTATINQSGGTVHVGNWAVLGVEGGGRGNWNMSDGAVAQLDNELNIGRNGGIGRMTLDTASVLQVNGEVDRKSVV